MSEILVVDDERIIRVALKRFLEGEGFVVRFARNGSEALSLFAEHKPDLVLLDVMMPKTNGFHVCEEIRRLDALTPIIFLSAKDPPADQVRGMGLGADDYLVKGTDESVLLARIRRALARTDAVRADTEALRDIQLGAVTISAGSQDVFQHGRVVEHLTKTEWDILRTLNARRGAFYTASNLIEALRGIGFACEDTMLYVHISNLRRKLGSAGDMIETIRRTGYRLRA